MKHLSVIFLFLCLLLVGCDDYRVPSNYSLAACKSVELYDYDYTKEQFVGTLDISPVSEALARSEWSSKNLIWKGGWCLKANDGKEIQVSYYAHFFRVSGVAGYFIIMEGDAEVFRKFFDRVSTEIVIPWRKNRNESH